jgi:tetratricopeptide (TPR) repeat protein
LAELSDDQSDAAAITTADLQALYSQLGRAYELTNAFTEARATYQEMLAQARALHDAQIEWAALNHLMTISTLMFDLDSAPALLQQARHLAERTGDKAGLAELEWNLAQASFYRLDFAAGLAHGGAALVLARDLGLIDLIARSLNVIAYTSLGCERWADVEAAATEAQALYTALGNRAMEADCLCQITAARINCGRTAAGVSAGRAARAISLEIDNAWGQVHSAVQLTPGLLDMGALTEALAVAQHGVDVARSQGIHMLPACLARLGTVYRALLDLDAARAIHLEALGLDAQNPLRPFTALIAAELCADVALVGSWEEAYRYAQQAAAAREHALLDYGFTVWLEVEALLRGGAGATASRTLSRLGERIGDNRRYRIPYLRALAVVAQSRGRSADALGHLEAAGALAHELGLPGELWQIHAARGDLYLERRDRDRALQAFTQASTILEMLAQKIEDSALRVGFLAADRVQHVLDVRP